MSNYSIVPNAALTATADAIRTKSGSQATIEFDHNTGFADAVNAIPSGSGDEYDAPLKNVVFIDYDGTILHNLTTQEFLALSELPANPTHDGLTSKGWNWTKAEITTQLSETPDDPIVVGQMYITTSGNTEVWINLDDALWLSPTIQFCVNGSITLDWGDGSSSETVSGSSLNTLITKTHTYAEPGLYKIIFSPVSGSLGFGRSSNTGTNGIIASTGTGYYYRGKLLEFLGGINLAINISALPNCGFKNVIIPYGVQAIGNNGLSGMDNTCAIIVPSTVSTIGTSWIGTAAGSIFATKYVSLPRECAGTGFYVQGLRSIRAAIIPYTQSSLANSTFSGCMNLVRITIPLTVTSIGTYAFSSCYGLKELHLKPTTPPTLSATSSISSLQAWCTIYVPYSADHSILEAYKTATNWSTKASQMQEEPQ